jgi:hypothetical protein
LRVGLCHTGSTLEVAGLNMYRIRDPGDVSVVWVLKDCILGRLWVNWTHREPIFSEMELHTHELDGS